MRPAGRRTRCGTTRPATTPRSRSPTPTAATRRPPSSTSSASQPRPTGWQAGWSWSTGQTCCSVSCRGRVLTGRPGALASAQADVKNTRSRITNTPGYRAVPRRSGHSGCAERVVSRCAEQILELAAADPDIAALDDRVGEGLGQVSHQRKVVVVGLDADDVHEPADDLDSHLRTEDLRVQS